MGSQKPAKMSSWWLDLTEHMSPLLSKSPWWYYCLCTPWAVFCPGSTVLTAQGIPMACSHSCYRGGPLPSLLFCMSIIPFPWNMISPSALCGYQVFTWDLPLCPLPLDQMRWAPNHFLFLPQSFLLWADPWLCKSMDWILPHRLGYLKRGPLKRRLS